MQAIKLDLSKTETFGMILLFVIISLVPRIQDHCVYVSFVNVSEFYSVAKRNTSTYVEARAREHDGAPSVNIYKLQGALSVCLTLRERPGAFFFLFSREPCKIRRNKLLRKFQPVSGCRFGESDGSARRILKRTPNGSCSDFDAPMGWFGLTMDRVNYTIILHTIL